MADSLTDVARALSVSPATLRRWVAEGIVPLRDGEWTPAALAQARIVARMRARGHSLAQLRGAAKQGRLAYGYLEDLFGDEGGGAPRTLEEAVEETGMEAELIRRIWAAAGFPAASLEALSDDDVALLRSLGTVLDSGLPLVAFLQIVRVYGQALAQIADAEVKLFHLFVHEPMIRDGAPVLEMAEELSGLASELLPLSGPIMESLHTRLLRHFLEQDVVGHLELVADDAQLGRMRVAICFADLAGYTRLTEEVGEEEALEVVERFVEQVTETLPDDARVIKTIGDEVMVVGTDLGALVDWAVGFQALQTERPLPRIGLHAGSVLYRDGDYYGRAVNLASRVAARATGGEVLVTREVRAVAGRHLAFQPIGEVKLKGFDEATELFLARSAAGR
ncbi:MerR family transcriptional regulator [Solirubrobacter phytolaccae]|uniref:MerR family transcriptional regulator n=1 Tax=Solirubrobacter phytolaccae TaxID=1404360 RepID=A0A9X3SCJ8_9ACTN|nr:adenylate/guanylate cyclase domain-containing protein [Solirubrobacter phytolaccae]MDA0182615.1 MerR family transcriptional regulator [Solirubrobacter phytolaccae]